MINIIDASKSEEPEEEISSVLLTGQDSKLSICRYGIIPHTEYNISPHTNNGRVLALRLI